MAKLYGVLGFRDFEAFNLALLAKQGWQMIHNDHSLCARIFKGTYFHNSSFIKQNWVTIHCLYGKVYWKVGG